MPDLQQEKNFSDNCVL